MTEFVVGQVEAGQASLLSVGEHHVVELPVPLLPAGARPGTVVRLDVQLDVEARLRRENELAALQELLVRQHGTPPELPTELSAAVVTYSSVTLAWGEPRRNGHLLHRVFARQDGKLLLANDVHPDSRSLTIYRLQSAREYAFQLEFWTSNGIYSTKPLTVRTNDAPRLTDLRPCVDQFDAHELQILMEVTTKAGIWITREFSGDVTHLVCKNRHSVFFDVAKRCNILIVSEDWLRSSIEHGNVRDFYDYLIEQ